MKGQQAPRPAIDPSQPRGRLLHPALRFTPEEAAFLKEVEGLRQHQRVHPMRLQTLLEEKGPGRRSGAKW